MLTSDALERRASAQTLDPRGIGAIVPTLLRAGEVDAEAMERVVDRMVSGGVQMLWALGAGGEQPMLCLERRREVLDAVIEASRGRVPVLAGVGDCSTEAVTRNVERAVEAGVSGVFVLEPYFYPLRPDELLAHFRTVAKASPVPVLLYHHPRRWGDATRTEDDVRRTLGELAALPQVVGVKDSVEDFRTHQRILFTVRDDDFRVLVSAGRLLMASLLLGSDGGAFHEAAVAPAHYRELYELVLAGRLDEARILQRRLSALGDVMARCDQVASKEALAMMGLCSPEATAPLGRMSDRDRTSLRAVLVELGLLENADDR